MGNKKRRTARKSRAVRKTNRKLTRASGKKIGFVFKKLIIFVILSIAFYLLYNITSEGVLNNLFFLLTFVLGFVSLAFFIVLLILLIMKGLKK
mgnify:CR=1 FL=1